MQNKTKKLVNCSRRFGVELEYNSLDKAGRSLAENNLPEGIYIYAQIISNKLKKQVEINKWHYTNNNKNWVLKPDASRGIEVCSPPLMGSFGTTQVAQVVEGMAEYRDVSADVRCSCHVHVEIADFTPQNLVDLFKCWTSYELFFYFLTSPSRWLNQYCQPLGFSIPHLSSSSSITASDVIHMLGDYKYYAINLYHYKKGKKRTVEFRIMDSEACLNPDDVVQWCKLLLCFVERVKSCNLGKSYVKYKSLVEAIDFLDLHSYFDNSEVSAWIIEKFSRLIDNEHLFDKHSNSKYIWNDLLKVMQPDIKETIKNLEEKIS